MHLVLFYTYKGIDSMFGLSQSLFQGLILSIRSLNIFWLIILVIKRLVIFYMPHVHQYVGDIPIFGAMVNAM